MASSDYYEHSTYPSTSATLASSAMRAELDLITSGISAKLPDLSGNGSKILAVNSGASALEAITTTGTGSGVRATSPTFTTPTLGVASATTINKVTFTTPATGATLTLADGATFAMAGAYAGTLTFTAATNVTLPTTGTLATLAGSETLSNKTLTAPALGTPASGVLTNCTGTASGLTAGAATTAVTATDTASKTGTGSTYATNTSPTFVTPTLGAATATSINGNTFTTGTYTLTGTAGKTLNFSNSLTLAGTDSTTMTFPTASASIGHLGIPQQSQATGYTCVIGDAGKHVYTTSSGGTYTIPANASVAYPVGTALSFINRSGGSVTIAITTDTMYLAAAGTTGSRTLGNYGMATAVKDTATTWIIAGSNLT